MKRDLMGMGNRNFAIAEQRKAGATSLELAKLFGLSRAQVDRVLSNPSASHHQRELRAAKWGMSLADFDAHVAEFGTARSKSSPMGRYMCSRSAAKFNGAPFDISFTAWFSAAQTSALLGEKAQGGRSAKVRAHPHAVRRTAAHKAPRLPRQELTRELLIQLLHYCEQTGSFTRLVDTGKRWKAGQAVGHFDTDSGYMKVGVNGKCYWAHRLAWLYVHGCMPPQQVDHIDGDRANNALSNLRLATQKENSQNQRHPRSKGKTSPIGTSYIKRSNRWSAQIGVNGKQIKLGNFLNVKDASAAYLAAKKIYHPFQTIAA